LAWDVSLEVGTAAAYTDLMGTKGYRNIAKSGVKAASARRRQAVAKAHTRKKPRIAGTLRKPRIEVVSDSDLEESHAEDAQAEAHVSSPEKAKK